MIFTKRNLISTSSSKSIEPENKLEIYIKCISDLLCNEDVESMSLFMQHSQVTCLEHCISVSYYSFLVCRFFGLNCRCAARGGLLHDLFLYDWHNTPPKLGLHAFVHPSIALENARKFNLNKIEKDIIKKHMWPLTIIPPRYFESFVVTIIDKYCAILEITRVGRRNSGLLSSLIIDFDSTQV